MFRSSQRTTSSLHDSPTRLPRPCFRGLTDAGSLPTELRALELEQLRDVVAYYGMDPRRLAMKWKSRERLIDHISQTVHARSHKGDAFRSPKDVK